MYGPGTPLVRRFLLQLAGLGAAECERVVSRYRDIVDAPAFVAAERILGETIARSGRDSARDALAGPLLQLVGEFDPLADPRDALTSLSEIAEPATAAILALVAADVLPPETFAALYRPFAEVMPFSGLTIGSRAP